MDIIESDYFDDDFLIDWVDPETGLAWLINQDGEVVCPAP